MALRFTRRGDRDQSSETSSVPLAPLIDMIFILLIFFLVTASFSRETGIQVEKPKAYTGSLLPKEQPLVSIRKDETIVINDRPVELAALGPRLQQRMKETGSRRVVVASDREVQTDLLVRVIDECKKAGAESVSIATRRKQK